jgi:sarcosine oxidase subunit beta
MADLAKGFYIRPHPEVFKVGAVLPRDHVAFTLRPEDPFDEEDRLRFERFVLEGLSRRAPGLTLTDVQTKVAAYDWTVSDAYPIVDATDVGGYFVAIGTSGAWFKAAPVLGELAARLIERERAGDPRRTFALDRTGNEIHLATFGLGVRT